ncbi:CAAX prenyl protease [Microbotryomycetes sp. JL201]|nr:CAAX prenyl protease [Microbotryomycetes sp. JL201]
MGAQLLSVGSAVLLSSTYTCLYVGSVILVPPFPVAAAANATSRAAVEPVAAQPASSVTASVPSGTALNEARSKPRRDRNDPGVIKSRLLAVSVATLAAVSSVVHTVKQHPSTPRDISVTSVLVRMGLWVSQRPTWSEWVKLVCLPLGLTASLFAGSLYVSALTHTLPCQRYGNWHHIKQEFITLQGLRNFVWGPLTEEVLFRSCIVTLSTLAGVSKAKIVFLTPLYFGLAHVHHAYETYVQGGKTARALKVSVLQTGFQLAYTTVFGWYASFLFMRTGSIVPPFLSHSFCNVMGLPPLGWALHEFPEHKASLWTTYAVGIATFCYGLWRWTEPNLFGGSVFWVV